jgi:site-specific recombinase XerC
LIDRRSQYDDHHQPGQAGGDQGDFSIQSRGSIHGAIHGTRREWPESADPLIVHTVQHRFANDLPENNDYIRTVQELLDHKDVSTTMIYTHVLKKPGLCVRSPLDG